MFNRLKSLLQKKKSTPTLLKSNKFGRKNVLQHSAEVNCKTDEESKAVLRHLLKVALNESLAIRLMVSRLSYDLYENLIPLLKELNEQSGNRVRIMGFRLDDDNYLKVLDYRPVNTLALSDYCVVGNRFYWRHLPNDKELQATAKLKDSLLADSLRLHFNKNWHQ